MEQKINAKGQKRKEEIAELKEEERSQCMDIEEANEEPTYTTKIIKENLHKFFYDIYPEFEEEEETRF